MTAILRHQPVSMSSVASHVYADLPQYPHLRPPYSHLPPPSSISQRHQQPEQNTRAGNEKYSAKGSRSIIRGASQQMPMNTGYLQNLDPYQQTSQQNSQRALQNSSVHQDSRPRSPIEEFSPKHVEFKQEPDSTDQIAPYLQIPLEINSSKGSLSDFASQVTCLFWFESSQTLLRVEESPSTPLPLQPLIPEANPTIGFRKWVTTILSTTQVSTNVVLLALMFVYRLKKMNPSVKGKPGSEYRLLTVALMLGNKFLDDNTYTNKTWGEVSGITVNEIHVMEVEFLSNMRYTLYASKGEWQCWLQRLRRFAEYFDTASRAAEDLRILSNRASISSIPPQVMHRAPSGVYTTSIKSMNNRTVYPLAMPPYPIQIPPASIPRMPDIESKSGSRKRSSDDLIDERPTKRMSRSFGINPLSDTISPIPSLGSASSIYSDQSTPRTITGYVDNSIPRGTSYPDQTARLPLPAMTNQQMLPQLPTYPQIPQMHMSRSMGSVYPPPPNLPSLELLKPQPHTQSQGPLSLRMPPMLDPAQTMSNSASRNNSPSASCMTPTGEHLSPMVYGHYRSSPYKPVRTVNSLLAPPPPTSLGNPANGIGSSGLQYRPLGKQLGQSRIGVVPHISQTYSQYAWPMQNVQGY